MLEDAVASASHRARIAIDAAASALVRRAARTRALSTMPVDKPADRHVRFALSALRGKGPSNYGQILASDFV
jgi:hypothetical protein